MAKRVFTPYKPYGRFYVVDTRDGGDGWTLADQFDGSCVSFSSSCKANDAARFARAYVLRHGDIDLQSFPYDLETPLHYESDQPFGNSREDRPWAIVDGNVVRATP